MPEAIFRSQCGCWPVWYKWAGLDLDNLSPNPITSKSGLIEINNLSQLALGISSTDILLRKPLCQVSDLANFLPPPFPPWLPAIRPPHSRGTDKIPRALTGLTEDGRRQSRSTIKSKVPKPWHWSLPYSGGPCRVDAGKFQKHCGHHRFWDGLALWLNLPSSAHLRCYTGLKINISHSFPQKIVAKHLPCARHCAGH